MDLLESGGGGNSIGALAKQLGIGGADTGKLVEALAPALMRGVQKQTERPDTMEGLTKALAGGGHQRYLDNPELIGDDAAEMLRDTGDFDDIAHSAGSALLLRSTVTPNHSGRIRMSQPMMPSWK